MPGVEYNVLIRNLFVHIAFDMCFYLHINVLSLLLRANIKGGGEVLKLGQSGTNTRLSKDRFAKVCLFRREQE